MKKAVKKTKRNTAEYARQKQFEKELWTMKVLAYTQQEMLDTAALTLAEEFGFGEKRQKQFHDAFERKYSEIRELEKGDTPDNEYAIAKQEEALKAACGKYYEPREVRYDIHIIDGHGRDYKV